jgi:parallel beta-helix repeat protein
MAIIKKKATVLSTLIILFILVTIGSILNVNTGNTNLESDKNQPYTNLRRSDYTPVSSIFIDDTDPTKNWAVIEARFDWCSGSGTEGDPYIIEFVSINGQFSGNCVYIGYSSVFFIIRNCIIYNSGLYFDGLYLNYVNNAQILNNNCSFNGDNGIFFQGGGNNNTILNNTVFNNRRAGIDLGSFSENCLISGNIISDNGQDGIVLRQDCDNNNISNNVIYNSGYSGILLQGGSDNNIVRENRVIKSLRGIMIYDNSNYNDILDNKISKSNENGMHIEESQYNYVKNNIIVDSLGDGIYFKSWVTFDNANNIISKNFIGENLGYGVSIDIYSFDNLIYFNKFVNNNINANDNGDYNHWDNGTIGNYWDNYSGNDLNLDNIGDTPYNISGSEKSKDNFPIYGDFFPPVIIINNPLPNQFFGFDAPDFDITVIGESLNATWYTLDGGVSNYSFSGASNSIDQTAWEIKESGIIFIRFYANDSLGRLSFAEINIIKTQDEFPEIPDFPVIPGFSLFSLIGVLLIATVAIIKRIKYNKFKKS